MSEAAEAPADIDLIKATEVPPPPSDEEWEKLLLDLSKEADKKGLFIFITSAARQGQYMRPDVLRNRIYLGEKFPKELRFEMREPRELEEQYMAQVERDKKLLEEIRQAIGEHKSVLGHELAREAEYAAIEDLLGQFAALSKDSPEYVRELRDMAVAIRSIVISNAVAQVQVAKLDGFPKSAPLRAAIVEMLRKP